MKRSFEREAKLTAFRCDLATLESFVTDLCIEFSPDKPRISINIDSFEEIKALEMLPASIVTFSIVLSNYKEGNSRYIYLGKATYKPYIKAKSSSEAWCAGIVEKTKRFAQSNRPWYWFISPWIPYSLMLLCALILSYSGIGMIVSKQLGTMKTASKLVTVLISLLLAGYLFFAYERIFSPIVLLVRSEESWIKKHSTEITIVAAIVSALATIYSALIK